LPARNKQGIKQKQNKNKIENKQKKPRPSGAGGGGVSGLPGTPAQMPGNAATKEY